MVLGSIGFGLSIPGNSLELMRPLGLFLGLVWLISGVATLYSYLRHNQPPAPEVE